MHLGEMIQLLSFAILFAPLVSTLAIMASPSPQEVLVHETSNPVREKVPGDNPAHFTRVRRSEQLFNIHEFTVSPYPPINNHHIFFYLSGDTSVHDNLPGLADATVELHINLPDDEDDDDTYFFKNKISDFKLFTVRDPEYNYGGPLVRGPNEMVGDFPVLYLGHDHGTMVWDIEAVARLPDDRILFAFKARVKYEY